MPANRTLIFVVDDEIILRQTLATLLVHAGYYATAFQSAEAALSCVDTMHPHLIVLDEETGRMTGRRFANELAATSLTTKLLLHSKMPTPPVVAEEARKRGQIVHVRPKPTRPEVLLAIIDELTS